MLTTQICCMGLTLSVIVRVNSVLSLKVPIFYCGDIITMTYFKTSIKRKIRYDLHTYNNISPRANQSQLHVRLQHHTWQLRVIIVLTNWKSRPHQWHDNHGYLSWSLFLIIINYNKSTVSYKLQMYKLQYDYYIQLQITNTIKCDYKSL